MGNRKFGVWGSETGPVRADDQASHRSGSITYRKSLTHGYRYDDSALTEYQVMAASAQWVNQEITGP
jgi:hypothetical protein